MESSEESSEYESVDLQRRPGTSDEDWEIEKFGRYMRTLIFNRSGKTDEENNKLIDKKYREFVKAVRYIRDIIEGKQETFDKDEECIHNEYFTEYAVACEIYEKEFPDLWRKYRENSKILGKKKKFRKKKGTEKGGEAGLVPRTYSMGAQPPQ
ncbi:hypothetical protein JTB14_005295 [Gonioctena quinquepunctata]|nr:hypothetical protein JTB14_005295 [Gonioctena quinquepunctata]